MENSNNKAQSVQKIINKKLYFIFILFFPILTNCQGPCQPPPSQPFTSFVGTPWRLIATTDPQISPQPSNYTFLIVQFNMNFTGEIYWVKNNNKFNNPVETFQYSVSSSNNQLTIQFNPQGQGASSTGPLPFPSGNDTYSYTLSNQFQLANTATGASYTFVQFTGGVTPGSSCTFN